ncbi:MAG: hypothetical protein RLZZ606_780 [Actinomycetota bacterium]|jgi:hypothetical protein
MARINIKDGNLQVSIGLLEKIQALQGSFTIPLANVRGATEDPTFISSGLGIRSPGTGLPGVIAKGTFRKRGEKTLTIWHKNQEIVVVELANSKWDRLVLGCSDAKALVATINKSLSK